MKGRERTAGNLSHQPTRIEQNRVRWFERMIVKERKKERIVNCMKRGESHDSSLSCPISLGVTLFYPSISFFFFLSLSEKFSLSLRHLLSPLSLFLDMIVIILSFVSIFVSVFKLGKRVWPMWTHFSILSLSLFIHSRTHHLRFTSCCLYHSPLTVSLSHSLIPSVHRLTSSSPH